MIINILVFFFLSNRTVMNELLFETYGAPSVSYGLDSLYSAYQNGIKDNGLIINSGNFSTTVVPLVNGKAVISSSKRWVFGNQNLSIDSLFSFEVSLIHPRSPFSLNSILSIRLSWGGSQASDYLLRLFQLKYPTFPLRLSQSQSDHLLTTQTFCSNSYSKELLYCSSPISGSDPRLGIEALDRIIQFPFPLPIRDEKTLEELKAQEEKRKESGRRLQEQQARLRFEKILEKERNLEIYKGIKEEKGKEKKVDWQVSTLLSL